ncbi:hypothetical protein AB7942_29140 [Neobacillus sp. BF23-41]|uniref:hypothetical protein n=1 Tax=Neobacillus sp. BF23-41 TaxID=3240280 RepID=UPI0034E3C3DB
MIRRPILGFAEFLFDYKMDTLEDLIKNMEYSLAKDLDNFEKYVEEQAKEYNEEQKQEYYDYMSDEYWKYKDDYPQIVRKSFFLQAYFSFEHLLIEICKHFKRKLDLKLEVKDINGQGLERSKIYISKVIGVSSPFQTPNWTKIQHYNQIRNSFVHNAGEYDENNKKHKAAHQQLKNVDVKNFEFMFNEEFCIEVINTLREFTKLIRSEFETVGNNK